MQMSPNRIINSYLRNHPSSLVGQVCSRQEIIKNPLRQRGVCEYGRLSRATLDRPRTFSTTKSKKRRTIKPLRSSKNNIRVERKGRISSSQTDKQFTIENLDVDAVTKQFGDVVNAAQDRFRKFFIPPSDRPVRVGPTMDGKWWAWNIAYALAPAFLLTLFFQYQRPQYEAYFEEANRSQRERLMQAMGMENEDELAVIRVEQKELAPFTKVAADGPTTAAVDEGDCIARNGEQLTDENQQGHDLLELLQRIDRLESIIKEKQRKERIIQFEMERLNQSGIQNRIQDRMIVEYAQEEVDERKALDASDLNKVQVALVDAVEKVKENGEYAWNKGKIVIQLVMDLFLKEHNYTTTNEHDVDGTDNPHRVDVVHPSCDQNILNGNQEGSEKDSSSSCSPLNGIQEKRVVETDLKTVADEVHPSNRPEHSESLSSVKSLVSKLFSRRDALERSDPSASRGADAEESGEKNIVDSSKL